MTSPLSAATTLPFQADFEVSDGFSLGTLSSDPDWSFDPNLLTVDIISVDAVSGTQSLQLTGAERFSLSATDSLSGQVRWIDFYLKPAFVEESDLFDSLSTLQSAVSAFVKSGGVGHVYVIDGDGLGGGTWVSAEEPLALLGETSRDWIRLTYRLDYAAQTWDLLLDDKLMLIDLGFVDDSSSALESFELKAVESTRTGFDSFYAGDVNPVYADADNDGIADSVDLNSTADDRDADGDGDGLSNIREAQLGTSLSMGDTDSDTHSDYLEYLWARDPLVADTDLAILGSDLMGGLFWQTEFELAEGYSLGALDGQLDWVSSPGVEVTDMYSQSVTSAEPSEAYVERYFNTEPAKKIWFGFTGQFYSAELPEAASLSEPAAAVFGFSALDTIAVLNPATGAWESYLVNDLVNQWNAYAVYLNYDNKTWELYQNGILIAENLSFADGSLQALSRFKASLEKVAGSDAASYMDLVQVYTGNDFDADGLGDDWERVYGFSPAGEDTDGNGVSDANEDRDSDGQNTLAEYTSGSLPTVSDTDVDYYVDQSLGDDALYNGQSAYPDLPSIGDGPKASLASAVAAAADGTRILILEGSFDESVLSLNGKSLTLRPNGNVILR